ncbi:MAG: zinc ribbon domain-containing protein [Deltaproteobacteria bacterium]|nr:MAG: zinc ribbon domain-containing protein [Deltaproteobacteria bacterium]
MPIYEFRCLGCSHCFELLSMSQDDMSEMKCPECEGVEVERVLSCVSYVMGATSGGDSGKTKVTSKSCSGGSCATIDIPGPTR